jgi:cbb3-type cytochrome oxidase subunit 1
VVRSADTGRGAVVDSALVQAHGIAAFVALLISVTFGIIVAEQLVHPDMAAGVPWLSWGRVRYAHTQGIMLGWLGNASSPSSITACRCSPAPGHERAARLVAVRGVESRSARAGWALVLAGISQPLEWAEFPLPVDAFVVLALVLAAVQFLPPFFRRGLEHLYVSSWYIIGGLIFTLLAYPMGNAVPEWVPGAQGAAFSGLWIHDAVGLFVTPLALAIIYFVIPAASGRPVYSHFLSMLGFWLLFFL